MKIEVESDFDDDNEILGKLCFEKNKNNFIDDRMFFEVVFVVDKVILREVEEIEEKVF